MIAPFLDPCLLVRFYIAITLPSASAVDVRCSVLVGILNILCRYVNE